MELLEEAGRDIAALAQELGLLHQGLQAAADIFIADPLRAREGPGIAPQIGQPLDDRLLQPIHLSAFALDVPCRLAGHDTLAL